MTLQVARTMGLCWCTGILISAARPFIFCWSGLNRTLHTMAVKAEVLIAFADDLPV